MSLLFLFLLLLSICNFQAPAEASFGSARATLQSERRQQEDEPRTQSIEIDTETAIAWETEAVSDLVARLAPQYSTIESRGEQRSSTRQRIRETANGYNFTEILNIEGLSYVDRRPPDTIGDVGLSQYVQMVNTGDGSKVRILDKESGAPQAQFLLDQLFPDTQQPCADGGGDPLVHYDQLADRWLLAEFAKTTFRLCVYISQTPDATKSYHAYEFETPSKPDYPKIGVWPQYYLLGTNEFTTDVPLYALERSAMLLGNDAKIIRQGGQPRLQGFLFQIAVPVDADGIRPPPNGTSGMFVRHVDAQFHDQEISVGSSAGEIAGRGESSNDRIEIWNMNVDFANSSATVELIQSVPVLDFDSALCGSAPTIFNCVPQPGTSTLLDSVREPVMHRPQYRNFETHESIVLNWVSDVDGTDRHGILWVELRRSGAENWTVYQQNIYSPDTDHRWMGSIAMNAEGTIALGYSVSSATTFPGIRLTGRLVNDTLGEMTMQEYIVQEGKGSQTAEQSQASRYGDYTAMTVDPVDDRTFWYTNQYLPVTGDWSTRMIKFRFEVCPEGEDCSDEPYACPRNDECDSFTLFKRCHRRRFRVHKKWFLSRLCKQKCVSERHIHLWEFFGYECGECL